jgi:26S proteasome non-ATPase regulatory subunit 5
MADMDIDQSGVDLPLLAAAASEFSNYPGEISDASVESFLAKFPLPVLLSALETGRDVPGLEPAVVTSLERIFRTSYGSKLLPHTLQYANVGLKADSPLVRKLTCVAIGDLLANGEKDGGATVRALAESQLAAPLLLAVGDGDAYVAKAAVDALGKLARSPGGLELIFTDKGAGSGVLRDLASQSSATVRIRALAMAASIFGVSEAAAAAVQGSGIFNVLAAELDNSDDMLSQLNALELLCELAVTPHGAKFLLAGNLIGRLTSTICNPTLDSLVRSRAMTVAARLTALYDKSSGSLMSGAEAAGIANAFGELLKFLEDMEQNGQPVDATEHENALDALSFIGKTVQGAELLFNPQTMVARHVMNAAFLHRALNIKLAGIHALATIAGSERDPSRVLLSESAEAQLKDMIYSAAGERSSTRTPAGMFLIFFQQSPEVRLAMYRFTAPMLARLWCLRELCASRELIDYLLDPRLETNKDAMEWRHVCCVAMTTALSAAIERGQIPSSETLSRLEEFVRRGPFQGKEDQKSAIPIYATQERM